LAHLLPGAIFQGNNRKTKDTRLPQNYAGTHLRLGRVEVKWWVESAAGALVASASSYVATAGALSVVRITAASVGGTGRTVAVATRGWRGEGRQRGLRG